MCCRSFWLSWARALIVRVDRADLPLRLGVGLAMLFFAFMSALSLLTPGVSTNGAVLFDANVLASRGGYVGSGIAWRFCSCSAKP